MSDIITKTITCAGGMPAFLAKPDAGAKKPVVILMHERYGLVDHTRDLAQRCARDGFLVLAPNFFYKHPEQDVLNRGDSRYDLADPESVEYLDAAMAAVAQEPDADMSRVAVAGYCQTGRHPLVYAAQRKIAAAIVWYGAASKREWKINERQPVALEDIIANVSCPVFGAFGASDHIIAVEDVRRMRDCLEANRKSYDINVYAGAPHGWLNDTMPGRYRKPQADAGWAAQQRFLSEVLAADYKPDPIHWRFDCAFDADYDFSKNVRLE
jgi:carboxymethylenebutenolidase